jgi:catechol 2,3-dioxygenase-like lactoylglutathione lyase family enzyme
VGRRRISLRCKWLFQPLEAGCLLVRDGAALERTFRVTPAYLRAAATGDEEVNFADRGIQHTRQFRALKLWMSLKIFGAGAFRTAIERGIQLAEHAEALLAADPDWEVVTPGPAGHRHVPSRPARRHECRAGGPSCRAWTNCSIARSHRLEHLRVRRARHRGDPPGGRGRTLSPAKREEQMLDHVGIGVTDYQRSKAFYLKALAPLGLTLLFEPVAEVAGFGEGGKPFFWIDTRGSAAQDAVHVAFAVEQRETVDAFHAAALEAGATDNGSPGVREIYHPHYYGAYVLDPDGNNVEAVCHSPA